MKSILITNIKWEKPTAHATCSYIDSSGYASGPIRLCLFIGYIITVVTNNGISSMSKCYEVGFSYYLTDPSNLLKTLIFWRAF